MKVFDEKKWRIATSDWFMNFEKSIGTILDDIATFLLVMISWGYWSLEKYILPNGFSGAIDNQLNYIFNKLPKS